MKLLLGPRTLNFAEKLKSSYTNFTQAIPFLDTPSKYTLGIHVQVLASELLGLKFV